MIYCTMSIGKYHSEKYSNDINRLATKHKVEDYANIYIAYFCIQGRGIAVILGTSSMLITRIISLNYNEIYAIDIDPDTEINKAQENVANNETQENKKMDTKQQVNTSGTMMEKKESKFVFDICFDNF